MQVTVSAVGDTLTVVAIGAAVLLLVALLWRAGRGRRDFGTPADRATFNTLHTASLAAPPLRSGLTAAGATRAARHLRTLLGTSAIALSNGGELLAWDGAGDGHGSRAVAHARNATEHARTELIGPDGVACSDPDCPIKVGVVAPLIVEERVVGSLAADGETTSAALVRATNEVARWVSAQLELAELD
ncbi:MAG: two-component system, LytTR family, sensor kinase, partial [Actinomycetota bacterium]|nr:two-component system, LytTR family, sensor kinase [Actinomycetota bacterium]